MHDEECVCGHDFGDHEPVSDGMLPLCFFCLCVSPKQVPDWIQKLRKQ